MYNVCVNLQWPIWKLIKTNRPSVHCDFGRTKSLELPTYEHISCNLLLIQWAQLYLSYQCFIIYFIIKGLKSVYGMIATNVWKKPTCTHTVVGVEYTYMI
jgi:hypothetical protein